MAVSWKFRAHDKDQLNQFIRDYYHVDNKVKPLADDRSIGGYFRGISSKEFTQAYLSVNTPLHYTADTAAFFLCSCKSGSLQINSSRGFYEVPVNASMCISPESVFDTITAPLFSCTATHLNTERVNRICSAWLGSDLDNPLQLEEGRFSSRFHEQWVLVTRSFDLMHASEHVDDRVFGSLEEYAVGLLLHSHPHNYSRFIGKRMAANERSVHDAQAYIKENAGKSLTPADVARAFGCPLPALRRGFEEHLDISLEECIYAARIAAAHKSFLNSNAQSYLEAFRASGFMNISRFEATYDRLYGEAPREAFERHRGGTPRTARLSDEKAELLRLHIAASLSSPLRVAELAAFVGMSESQFYSAFKDVFGVSPAQYILSERLDMAQWLLVNTDKSIMDIATETGFSSQAHMTAAFRQHHGMTPGSLRRIGKYS